MDIYVYVQLLQGRVGSRVDTDPDTAPTLTKNPGTLSTRLALFVSVCVCVYKSLSSFFFFVLCVFFITFKKGDRHTPTTYWRAQSISLHPFRVCFRFRFSLQVFVFCFVNFFFFIFKNGEFHFDSVAVCCLTIMSFHFQYEEAFLL